MGLRLEGNVLFVEMTDPDTLGLALSQVSLILGGQVCVSFNGSFTSFTCLLPTNPDGSLMLS